MINRQDFDGLLFHAVEGDVRQRVKHKLPRPFLASERGHETAAFFSDSIAA